MPCSGNGQDHCCWLSGVACKYLEVDTVPGRKWSCGLVNKYGSWEAAEASEEYQSDVQPFWDSWRDGTGSCSKWPDEMGEHCATCGAGVNGNDT